jgi:hypothetical protein
MHKGTRRSAHVLSMEKPADVDAFPRVQTRKLPIRARRVRGAVFEALDELFLFDLLDILVLLFFIVTAHIHLLLFFSLLSGMINVVLGAHLQLRKYGFLFDLPVDLHLVIIFFPSTEFFPALWAGESCAFAGFDEDFDGFLGSDVDVTQAEDGAQKS